MPVFGTNVHAHDLFGRGITTAVALVWLQLRIYSLQTLPYPTAKNICISIMIGLYPG